MLVYKYRGFDNISRDINSLLNNQYYASLFKDLNDPAENTFNDTIEDTLKLIERIFSIDASEVRKHLEGIKAFSNTMGVYSLTNSPFNELMWSHYASSHKGFVIEYDYTKLQEIINFPLIEDINSIRVKYSRNPPNINTKDISNQHRLLQKLFGTKSKSWEYEKEVRIISDNAGLRTYFPSALKAIFFGLKFPEEEQHKIIELLKHPNLRFYKIIHRHNNSYLLDSVLLHENSCSYGVHDYDYEYKTGHNPAVENFYVKYKDDFSDRDSVKLFIDLFLEKYSERRHNLLLMDKEFELSKTSDLYNNYDYIENHKIAEKMVDDNTVFWGVKAPKL